RAASGPRALRRPADGGRHRHRERAGRVRGDQGRLQADRARHPLGVTVPLLTADLPGTSGLTRVTEEDFRVEEIPLYQPSGAGEHLYLTIEKTGRTTQEVAREIAQALGVRERDVGTAGLKDKRGVTVQRMSAATRVGPEEAVKLSGRGFRVLDAA